MVLRGWEARHASRRCAGSEACHAVCAVIADSLLLFEVVFPVLGEAFGDSLIVVATFLAGIAENDVFGFGDHDGHGHAIPGVVGVGVGRERRRDDARS